MCTYLFVLQYNFAINPIHNDQNIVNLDPEHTCNINSFSSYEVKLVYACIFISLYNFAISPIHNDQNIVNLDPEHYQQFFVI